LRCLVLIEPEEDCLPLRTTYGDGPAATNIGLNFVTGPPTWYTLADVVASILLTGKGPRILDAVRFVPVGRIETKPWRLLGDDRYLIDPRADDVFVGIINLRRAVQADAATAETAGEREYLDGLQRGLKLLANSASYGVLQEINQEERTQRRKPVRAYHMNEQSTTGHVLERPGPFFAGRH
jgi:hypothetical protein